MSIIITKYSKQVLFELIKENKISSEQLKVNELLIDLNQLLTKNGCTIIYVEDEYDDSEIIAEYNALYSKTFVKYPRTTKRIHFFKNISLTDNFFIGDEFYILDINSLESSYLGYFTLRPFSIGNILGPSFFRFPSLLKKMDVSVKKLINFNGDEMLLEGVPFIQHDGHLFSSPESCIWIFLELYKTQSFNFTLEDISRKLYNRNHIHNPINQKGVTVDNILSFFQELGFGCQIMAKDIFIFEEMLEQLIFMLDSSIPVLSVFFTHDDIRHLVIFIGYYYNSNNKLTFRFIDPNKKFINEINPEELENKLSFLITVNPKSILGDIFFAPDFLSYLLDMTSSFCNIDTTRYKIKKQIIKSKKFKKYVAFSTMENNLKVVYLNSRFPEDILLVQFYKEDINIAYGEIILDLTFIEPKIDMCLYAHLENKLVIGTSMSNSDYFESVVFDSKDEPYQSFMQFTKGDFKIKQLPKLGTFDIILDKTFLSKVIARIKENTVLVLGKDTGKELKVLHKIQQILHSLNYKSILVKDLDDIPSQCNEEKVRLCAQLTEFTILENSYPAGQIAELSKICSTSRIVTATLRDENKGSSYMVTDYDIDYNHIKEFKYKNTNDLEIKVKLAIKWAESYIKSKIVNYNKIYPWRK